MCTRSSTRNRPQQQVTPNIEPFDLEEPIENQAPPIVTMADTRTMAEAWDRFKDLLRACPHHGFSELHQLDTFYNALNSNDQDSLNSAAGGNFLDKMPRDCLAFIESKSKVCYSQSKAIVAKVSTSSSTPGVSPDVAKLKEMVKALLLDKKNQSQAPATVKAVEESCVTCSGAHSYRNCPATDGNVYRDNIQEYVSQASAVNYNQGNTDYHPPMIANQIRPPDFPPVQNNQNNQRNNQNHYNQNQGNNYNQVPIYQPPAYQASAPQTQIPPPPSSLPKVVEHEPDVTNDTVQLSTENIQPPVAQTQTQIDEPVVAPKPKPTIPCPSRINKQKLREKDDLLTLKFMEIFRNLHFELSFADALLHMPKFAPMFRKLLNNKDKIISLIKSSVNENCSAVILKKFPEKLGDLELNLPDLTKTRMILELADRTISTPTGIAEDVFVKVRTFFFAADFIVIDYIADPRVPLILERPFLWTTRALIDVHACEEYAQEVLGFLDISKSGNPTPTSKSIISTFPPSLTPFSGVDFILEEIDAYLASDSIPPGMDDTDFDPEGDILLLENYLNNDPSSSLPPEELKFVEPKTKKSSIDEPPELELKDLPSHLEYAFLEGADKLPVIIAKTLKEYEKV
ncbi:reverse transcriptase domain-containing protein [Tanacetum coccineum]